ncbi:serine--tRNA ligase [Carnobacterium sp. 17-4]|uniref:serine--tRNA ligase n=1 Tax=Carnobacterium sp. (strain 17-4) TaxID=208596 RepID=UPI0002058EE2|nr:serine--tRNA ligase [Carnobacterium sp. 17-4]AEB30808.1 serine--tRNA ligase [Carnobacterium sp. 17-4]
MLDISRIRTNEDHYHQRMIDRGIEKRVIKEIINLDEDRRTKLKEVEYLRNEKNMAYKKVQQLKKNGVYTDEVDYDTKEKNKEIKKLQEQLTSIEEELNDILFTLPNIADGSVPIGNDEQENEEIRVNGEKKKFEFEVLPHYELGENLGILDFVRGSKVAGKRFVYYKGLGARLERAVYNFMLDLHTRKHGYTEVIPPYLVKESAMFGTGQFPKFKEDVFSIENENLVLIPTAEVPLTNYYANEIIEYEKLPIYFTALSPSFRSEAGSAGRDTRGLIRMHQFHKVEMVKFTDKESSFDELEKMTHDAEEVLQLLEIPYKTIVLSTGDMGFSATKTYDIEVWFPSQDTYREISSCSNCLDFQARRAKIRYRDSKGKIEFVHTLNGSGLAVGRTVAAILENYQQLDGSILVPTILIPYMDGIEVIH